MNPRQTVRDGVDPKSMQSVAGWCHEAENCLAVDIVGQPPNNDDCFNCNL